MCNLTKALRITHTKQCTSVQTNFFATWHTSSCFTAYRQANVHKIRWRLPLSLSVYLTHSARALFCKYFPIYNFCEKKKETALYISYS